MVTHRVRRGAVLGVRLERWELVARDEVLYPPQPWSKVMFTGLVRFERWATGVTLGDVLAADETMETFSQAASLTLLQTSLLSSLPHISETMRTRA